MVTTPWRIDRLRRETSDTFTLVLGPRGKNGGNAFSFQPGQFNMLYAFGIGEVPISISGNPESGRQLEHTTRVVGAVTGALGRLRDGDHIGVRGPFGSAWPVEQAAGRDVVLIAGGIGLAPLRPVYRTLAKKRGDFGRISVLYGARTPEDILFRAELEELSSKLDIEVFVTVDRATIGWYGNVGVVTTLVRRAPFEGRNTIAMVCGPEIMMTYAVEALLKRGVRGGDVYISMERNMKCGIGHCGHCQYGPAFVCRDGPVFSHESVAPLLAAREL